MELNFEKFSHHILVKYQRIRVIKVGLVECWWDISNVKHLLEGFESGFGMIFHCKYLREQIKLGFMASFWSIIILIVFSRY